MNVLLSLKEITILTIKMLVHARGPASYRPEISKQVF
jgi:hypothetical protein